MYEIQYRGVKTESGQCHVFRDTQLLSPERSQKVLNHSPEGFSWGYGGSGPAQLALALLLDVTDDVAMSRSLHQRFKAEVIAKLDTEDNFLLFHDTIRRWVHHRIAQEQVDLAKNYYGQGCCEDSPIEEPEMIDDHEEASEA